MGGWGWRRVGLFFYLRETCIPNLGTLPSLEPLEKVPGGWWWYLNPILVISLSLSQAEQKQAIAKKEFYYIYVPISGNICFWILFQIVTSGRQCSWSPFRRLTGNDCYIYHSFPFFITTFSLRTVARIKIL